MKKTREASKSSGSAASPGNSRPSQIRTALPTTTLATEAFYYQPQEQQLVGKFCEQVSSYDCTPAAPSSKSLPHQKNYPVIVDLPPPPLNLMLRKRVRRAERGMVLRHEQISDCDI